MSARKTLRALGGRVFFAAADSAHGEELWTSDGTPEGTALVEDVDPRPAMGPRPSS